MMRNDWADFGDFPAGEAGIRKPQLPADALLHGQSGAGQVLPLEADGQGRLLVMVTQGGYTGRLPVAVPLVTGVLEAGGGMNLHCISVINTSAAPVGLWLYVHDDQPGVQHSFAICGGNIPAYSGWLWRGSLTLDAVQLYGRASATGLMLTCSLRRLAGSL